MNDIVVGLILFGLVLYFEWDLVTTALSPIVDIIVSVFFIFMLAVVIVVELALIVIAPVALVFGYESRQWHINAARKLMCGGKKNADGYTKSSWL